MISEVVIQEEICSLESDLDQIDSIKSLESCKEAFEQEISNLRKIFINHNYRKHI